MVYKSTKDPGRVEKILFDQFYFISVTSTVGRTIDVISMYIYLSIIGKTHCQKYIYFITDIGLLGY